MTDTLAPAERSVHMARIRSRNTAPERLVRSALHAAGFRFRLHVGHLPGTPDIVLSRHRTVILVHGCFWHRHEGCSLTYLPKTRPEFWRCKFKANVERDDRQKRALISEGWRVIIVWECAVRDVRRRSGMLEALVSAVTLPGNIDRVELPPRLSLAN